MITLNGTCWLRVAGKELQCVPKLLNTNYADGRTGFYIVSEDDETYTWSGKGGHKPSPDSQVLLVDQFIATSKGKTTGWPAKGSCQYQNPYRGKPTTFNAPTRATLQDVFEFVWLAVIDADLGPISRNELAVLIVKAHNSGLQPEAIKDAVLYQLKHQRRTLI